MFSVLSSVSCLELGCLVLGESILLAVRKPVLAQPWGPNPITVPSFPLGGSELLRQKESNHLPRANGYQMGKEREHKTEHLQMLGTLKTVLVNNSQMS